MKIKGCLVVGAAVILFVIFFVYLVVTIPTGETTSFAIKVLAQLSP